MKMQGKMYGAKILGNTFWVDGVSGTWVDMTNGEKNG